MYRVLMLFVLIAASSVYAQTPLPPDPPSRVWKASWTTHPTAPLRDPIVLHFRRPLTLPSAPELDAALQKLIESAQ